MKGIIKGIAVGAFIALVAGCGGNTNTSSTDYTDDIANDTDQFGGRVQVIVEDTSIAIGKTSRFHTFVYDRNNRPLENARIICNSTPGVAILDPLEIPIEGRLTSDQGDIEGTIGCERLGNFWFGCQIPGAPQWSMVKISCVGSISDTFTFTPMSGGQF